MFITDFTVHYFAYDEEMLKELTTRKILQISCTYLDKILNFKEIILSFQWSIPLPDTREMCMNEHSYGIMVH